MIRQKDALNSGKICASRALCLSSSLPTGAVVPELQLFGQFGGSPILLATTEQLKYFDCRSYVKCVKYPNCHMMVT